MLPQELMINLSIGTMAVFLVLATIDGVYLHLIRFRLPEHRGSRFEHLLHTVRAILFVPTVWLLYFKNVSGTALWIAAFLVLADFGFQSVDILEERRSRMRIGGLPSGEYLLHVTEGILHFCAFTVAFMLKPIAAWSSEIMLPEFGENVRHIATIMMLGGSAIAMLHLILIPFPFFVSRIIGTLGKQV